MDWKREWERDIEMLHDTLGILECGERTINGTPTKLKLTRDEMSQTQVFLPDDVAALSLSVVQLPARETNQFCAFSCENTDSFVMARKLKKECPERDVLVLNLANPVNPGGGVYRGAESQEEDLCRKSSLLVSLESKEAQRYYDYNRALSTYMGSDAVIITPKVEIIKDENGALLEDSIVVSAMTCAAPKVTFGLEGLSVSQYIDMVYNRIVGMLKVAAHCGYRVLVLGAFGCGAFGNDAHIVSDIFYDAITEFNFCGLSVDDLFDRIDFAVLDRTEEQYNFKEFSWNFSDFYHKQ